MVGRKGRLRQRGPMLAGLLTATIVALLQLAGLAPLDEVGLRVFDSFARAAPRAYADARVRVVDIDEDSIARLGQWPWPRTDLARLNRVLAAAGAKAIAYDMVFSEPDRTSPAAVAARLGLGNRFAGLPDNDQVFADSMKGAHVIDGLFLLRHANGSQVEPAGISIFGSLPDQTMTNLPGSVQPLPVLQANAAGAGSLSRAVPGDPDGIVRRVPLVQLSGRNLVPSLSLEAVRVWLGVDNLMVMTSNGSGEPGAKSGSMVSVRVGNIVVPTDDAGEMWIHYAAPGQQKVIPAWKLLTGAMTPQQVKAAVGGSIVFVGTSATGLLDLVDTPLAQHEAGVKVHAEAAEQMLLGQFLERPDWAPSFELALVLVLGGGLALLLPRLGATGGAVVGALGIAAVAAMSWLAYTRANYLLDPIYPALAIVLVYVVQTVMVFYREERRRAYIHRAFDPYLSPELVKQIAADPARLELGGEEREMTVLMCDIRGFSRISERHSPQQVIEFLIAFLTPMSDLLLAHKATLDKYIGDAILAFWNAPLDNLDHFRDGARAALAMVAKLDELNREMPASMGDVWPEQVSIGIGLNSGLCCVGNMGSRQRLSYSLIGDTVNVASRLEGLTKLYGVPIVVGSALAAHLEGFALLELDRVRVVGRDAPETIFALVGDETVAGSAEFQTLAAAQQAFLRAYRAADWPEAERRLGELAAGYAAHGFASLGDRWRERLAALRADPPGPGWDGVYQATEK
ncbi:MAG: CHASE2 domain-containing protein [Croceibacterium sp.]